MKNTLVQKYSKVVFALCVAVPATWAAVVLKGVGSFLFAWVFNLILMMVVLAINDAVQPRFKGRYFASRQWEKDGKFYEPFGVHVFRKILVWIGWEKLHKTANPVTKRADALRHLEYATRQSEFGHALILLVTSGVALAVAYRYGFSGSVWLLALNMPLHIYPIMLQRFNRPRYQKILCRFDEGIEKN